MSRTRVAAVDIGGSGVRAQLESSGPITRLPLADRSLECVVTTIRELVPVGVEALGVAVPGFLNAGVIQASPNFPDWRDVPLVEHLESRLGVPVCVENDATAAALGAYASRGACEDIVVLTLGTGVGGGAVLGGRAVRGRTGSAGELGHLFAGGDQQCGCGARGCLETLASTSGWQVRTGRSDLDGRMVVTAAQSGETWALELLEEAGAALGRAARSIANFCDPDVIAFAGGLTAARPWLESGISAGLKHAAKPIAARVRVEWLGGADALALHGMHAAALSLVASCGELSR